MTAWTIRTLRLDDASPLLKFEQRNREWFERHIVPRPVEFYCGEGVLDHVEQFLAAYRQGSMHPCVIVGPEGEILGRANLKDIEAGRAEVGYRIAQDHTGKGLATSALRHLLELASTRWRLVQLFAYVAEPNRASVRVLERCGFARGPRVSGLGPIAGAGVDGYQFSLDLSQAAR